MTYRTVSDPVSCNGFQCDLVDGLDYSTSKTRDKAKLGVVIPTVVIMIILLGVYASRRQRRRLETLPEKEDMHRYLQWKAKVEAGQAKREMKAEEKRFEIERENVRAEMSEAGDDRLVLRSLQEKHELSGEEVSKELDIQLDM